MKLRRWIICFAVVEFNLDTGVSRVRATPLRSSSLLLISTAAPQPDLDNVYPPTRFSAAVQSNIAFSSLPEGELPTAGAHAYSWRIPISPPTKEEERKVGYKSPDPLPEGGDGWLYGFVWFQQEKVGFVLLCSSVESLTSFSLSTE